MEKEDRRTLVELQVEKAKRFLSQADEMVDLKHWDLAGKPPLDSLVTPI